MIISDDRLFQVSTPLVPGDALSFLADMREELRIRRAAVGLSAIQIGIPKRAIILRPNYGLGMTIMLNPEIVFRNERTFQSREGCLSKPGFFTDVTRSYSVRVRWFDEHWRPQTRLFTAFDSAIIQHEMDHLEGKVIWKGTDATP